MKKLFTIIIIMAIAPVAMAQYVSLNNTEVKRLQTAIQSDAKVKKAYEPYREAALKALNESPNPIELIRSQGLLMSDPRKTASLAAVEDVRKIYSLALYYRLFNDKAYFTKAQEFLTAWAKVNKASGGPIDETKLEELFAGYDLIRPEMAKEPKAAIDAWLDSIAEAEVNSESAKNGKSTAKNNWNSHRIKVFTQIAYVIHSSKYDQIIKTELEKQIAQNLYADGSGYDFEQRDALHYHIYTLEPMMLAAVTINRAGGKNYYTYLAPNNASIEKSVKFLAQFVSGEKTHQEFVKSTVKFDRDRAANGEKGYKPGTYFEPKAGIIAIALAAWFDPANNEVIRKAAGDQYYDWQMVLNQVRDKPKN